MQPVQDRVLATAPCGECNHAAEGRIPENTTVFLRRIFRLKPAVISCSTFVVENPMMDGGYCRCTHSSHWISVSADPEDHLVDNSYC